MKYLILLLVMTVNAEAGSRQEEYINSCISAMVRILQNSGKPVKGDSKGFAKEACENSAQGLTEANKWNLVPNPKYDGCSDAIYILSTLDKKLQNDHEARRRMAMSICF